MAVKKAARKRTPLALKEKESVAKSASLQTSKYSRKNLIIGFILLLIVGGVYILRNQIIVATVNGQPITRVTLIQELEKQQGKRTLDGIITKTLIFQEGDKKNLTAMDSEVDAELKKVSDGLKQQGQDLNTALSAQGMTLEGLKEQIKIQLTLKKLVAKQIAVSDKEINDYISKNKENLPKMDEKELKANVKAQLEQEKLSQAANELIQNLRSKGKISDNLFK